MEIKIKIMWNKEINKDIIKSKQVCQNVCEADTIKINNLSFAKGLCCGVLKYF